MQVWLELRMIELTSKTQLRNIQEKSWICLDLISSGRREASIEESFEQNDEEAPENEDCLGEKVEILEKDEAGTDGGLKCVRKRKVPIWRRDNADVWEEEEEENEEKETSSVKRRKLYSQRKRTFSPEEKGVRMLQTPVSWSTRNKWQKQKRKVKSSLEIFCRPSLAAAVVGKIVRTIKLSLNTGG